MCGTDIFLAVLAVLFPPLPVWVKRGVCSADSLINIALCCLGVLPGLLHAWYIIWAYPDPDYEYERVDSEAPGHVTYYYVAHGPTPQNTLRGQPKPQSQPRYGATGAGMPASNQQQFPGQQTGTSNSFAPQQGGHGDADAARGSNQAPPPSYQEAVRGDHKVQT
ncbi:hypothetical protein IWX90DRAFT_388466 [Phyllosticta citrichinensis]|uniref:Stress response RCI peptide n=1 Tax=Phyllosticta citrichinensis TaxID=1130410 RepID=A0ABR1XP18_9PEZI